MSVKVRTNLFLDIAIFVALLLALAPRVTGIAIHEWLSLAFAGAVIVHLLFHWEWIVTTGPRFFANLFQESRLNFVVDLLFYLSLVAIMVSGVVISKVALPAVGVRFSFSPVWKQVHKISADVGLAAMGVHCGLHARWIAQTGKRCIVDPVIRLFKRQPSVQQVSGGKA